MHITILNREFKHPADGWYQIEALGNHPNRAAGVVQVIDRPAAEAIVGTFNSEAKAGTLRHGSEMLIDHEHFKDDADKESRAYGWLQELQNREDGIYGRIHWTGTGKAAVDGGDYRFFSTEYAPGDLKVLNADKKVKQVRPLRLDGLSLTNMNNNRGQKPITNRSPGDTNREMPADGCCPDCDCELNAADATGVRVCPECETNFASPGGLASDQQPNIKNKMKNIATALGLDANTDEQGIVAVVTKLMNRGDITIADLTKLKNRSTELETEHQTLMGEQIDALMDAHGIKADDAGKRDKLCPVLASLKNREERMAFLTECCPAATTTTAAGQEQRKLYNRDAKTPNGNKGAGEVNEQEVADKIRNRATELQGKGMKFEQAWNAARTEVTRQN